jgi:hypothetical protein
MSNVSSILATQLISLLAAFGGRNWIANPSNSARFHKSIYFFDISKIFFETKNKKFRIMH